MAIGDDMLARMMEQISAGLGDDDAAGARLREMATRERLEEQSERNRQAQIARRALDTDAGRALLGLLRDKLGRPLSRDGLTLEQYALGSAERNGQLALLAMIDDMLAHGREPKHGGEA